MNLKIPSILILAAFSCNSPKNDFYSFDPRILAENEITLSDIADDIVYLPLDNKYLISDINRLIITNNSIFLNARGGIFALNRDGKIVRKIGNKGRGPAEYIYSSDFTVDDNEEIVYIRDKNDVIKVYSKNGNFLRNIHYKKYEGSINIIESFNSELFIFYFMQFGDSKNDWIILDSLGNYINKKSRSIPIFTSNFLASGGIYKFENKLYSWNPYSDTVFAIYPDLSWNTAFLISPGEHRLPRSEFDVDKQLIQFVRLYSIIETSHFLVFRYAFNKIGVIALVEKKNWKSFLAYWESENRGGIINNLDGGYSFQPKSYFKENDREYLVGLIDPFQLKAYVASNKFKSSVPKYPEKKKELEKLANSLEETDNPVLMMVRLKQ